MKTETNINGGTIGFSAAPAGAAILFIGLNATAQPGDDL